MTHLIYATFCRMQEILATHFLLAQNEISRIPHYVECKKSGLSE